MAMLGRVVAGMVCACAACSSGKTPTPRPAVEPAASRSAPAPAIDAVPVARADVGASDDGVDEDDGSIEPEFDLDPFSADLDGDGAPDAVAWTCDGVLRVTVGAARASAKYDVSELIGCTAATVALVPGSPARQLVVSVGEHEEVGPDHQFFYAYDGATLALIWSGIRELAFERDGSWVAVDWDCNEFTGVVSTTTTVMRFDGAKVTSSERVATRPAEAGECEEP